MDSYKQCTAKSKQSGQRCKRRVTRGREVCRMHGGKIPRGPALPQFRHGRYSKVLPLQMAAKYRDAAQDPELLSLHSEIALLDARMAELLGRVDTGESEAMWDALQQAWAVFRHARNRRDMRQMHLALDKLDVLMDRQHTDHAAWQEIGEAIEQRRKLVESEQRRLIALQAMLSQEQAMTLMGVLVDIVTTHVRDQPTLAQIVADLEAMLEHDGSPRRPAVRGECLILGGPA
jgi:hypothetical protein